MNILKYQGKEYNADKIVAFATVPLRLNRDELDSTQVGELKDGVSVATPIVILNEGTPYLLMGELPKDQEVIACKMISKFQLKKCLIREDTPTVRIDRTKVIRYPDYTGRRNTVKRGR